MEKEKYDQKIRDSNRIAIMRHLAEKNNKEGKKKKRRRDVGKDIRSCDWGNQEE